MWRSLCRVLQLDELSEHPDYRDNASRMANRDRLRHLLEVSLRHQDKEEWTRRFIAAGIPAGPINSIREALQDLHVRAIGCIETVKHPTLGLISQLTNPIRFGCSAPSSRTAPPLLGEHTSEVLRIFGFDERIIEDLLQRGIVREATPTKSE
jgi:formyl-CoA transferase